MIKYQVSASAESRINRENRLNAEPVAYLRKKMQ